MKTSLKPTHRPLWRDERTVQLGLDDSAVVVGDLSLPTARVLGRLDGTRDDGELRASGPGAAVLLDLLAGGRCTEVPPSAVPPRLAADRALLGLLHPDPGEADRALAHRAAARVVVAGGGRVGAVLAHLLAASGVGRVTVIDPAPVTAADACPGGLHESDAGLRRGAAATALGVRALAPVLDTGPPDLVVLCPDGPAPPDPAVFQPWQQQGVALLVASVVQTTAVVGPFTRPGGSCCPGCVSRHRADRDPSWPLVERQLLDPARVPASTASAQLTAAAAAAACSEVLGWFDEIAVRGRAAPASEHATLELALPGWRWRRRHWGPHPDCPCTGADAEARAGTSRGGRAPSGGGAGGG